MNSVALVVLNYNGVNHLKTLLPSLMAACERSPIPARYLVLDNRSPNGDMDWLRNNHPKVEAVVAAENDFLFSYNQLLPELSDDVVILLNNDMRVEPGFIGPLLRHLRHEDVFAVSARSYDWEGKQTTTGPVSLVFEHGFYGWPFDIARQERTHTLFCSGACMAVDREKFVALGGFDRLFHPAYCEDLDLCFRAWRRGWRCVYEPESIVYHREHASWQSTGSSYVSKLGLRNSLLFQWSSLPLERRRPERAVRTANLIIRGLLRGDTTWLTAWLRALLFWFTSGGWLRNKRATQGELARLLEEMVTDPA